MEKLAALFILSAEKLCIKADYQAELNRMFLENPKDDLLLEIETLGIPENFNSWSKIWDLLEGRISDRSLFEKEFFAALGNFYDMYCISDEEYEEILARFGTDWEARGAYYRETGKITLWEFSERCFKAAHSINIDQKLENMLMNPHYAYENMDRHAGELPKTDEEYIEEIRQNFRKTFDYYKENK